MTKALTPMQRAQLGILNAEAGDEEVVEIVAEGVALGKGPAAVTLATVLTARPGVLSFTPVPSNLAAQCGVRLSLCDQNLFLLLLEDEHARTPRARVLCESDPPGRPGGEAGTLAVDLSHGPAAFAIAKERIEVESDGSRLRLRRLHPKPRARGLSPEIDVPLDEWAADCPDRWLAAQLQSRTASSDVWSRAVAAGLYARLLTPDSPRVTAEIVEASLRGTTHELLLRPHAWAHALSTEARSFLVARALSEADLLFDELDDLALHPALDDPSWRERLRSICLRRDDLEAARAILGQGRESESFAATLDALDRRGGDFIHTLAWVVCIDDERLRRASLADPQAWWAEPAAPEHLVDDDTLPPA